MNRTSRLKATVATGILLALLALATALIAQEKASKESPKKPSHKEMVKMQKEAYEDMKAMATGVQTFILDFKQYPDPASGSKEEFFLVHFDEFNEKVGIPGDLASKLVPDYIKKIPAKDPWGNPYLYGISSDKKRFVLVCTGSDGVRNAKPLPDKQTPTMCFEDDMIWSCDHFVQYPEGNQKVCGKK